MIASSRNVACIAAGSSAPATPRGIAARRANPRRQRCAGRPMTVPGCVPSAERNCRPSAPGVRRATVPAAANAQPHSGATDVVSYDGVSYP